MAGALGPTVSEAFKWLAPLPVLITFRQNRHEGEIGAISYKREYQSI